MKKLLTLILTVFALVSCAEDIVDLTGSIQGAWQILTALTVCVSRLCWRHWTALRMTIGAKIATCGSIVARGWSGIWVLWIWQCHSRPARCSRSVTPSIATSRRRISCRSQVATPASSGSAPRSVRRTRQPTTATLQ